MTITLGREIVPLPLLVVHRDLLGYIIDNHQRPRGLRVRDLTRFNGRMPATNGKYVKQLRAMGLLEPHTTMPTNRPRPWRLAPKMLAILQRVEQQLAAGVVCTSGTLAEHFGDDRKGMSVRVAELRAMNLLLPFATLRPTAEGVRWDRRVPR